MLRAAAADLLSVFKKSYYVHGPDLEGERDGILNQILLLLEKGANPNATTAIFYEISGYRSCLHPNADVGDPGEVNPLMLRVMERAIQKGLDCTVSSENHDYPRPLLHHVAAMGHPELMKLLLRHHAPLELHDNWGNTPLLSAHRAENILLMIQAGAQIDACDKQGLTPFQVWTWHMHEALLHPKYVKDYIGALMQIDDFRRRDSRLLSDPNLRREIDTWGLLGELRPREAPNLTKLRLWDQFDAPRLARHYELPRNTVLTRYVQGAVAEKERGA